MASLTYASFDIVGFDGVPRRDCGRARPVLRLRGTEDYFRYSASLEGLQSSGRFGARDFEWNVQEGYLTKLPKPIPAFAGAMALYVSEGFLDAVENAPGDQFEVLCDEPSRVWVRCEREETVERMMNEWGRTLWDRSDRALIGYFATNDPVFRYEAERLARMGLDAARDLGLRSRLYLQLGVAFIHSAEGRAQLSNWHRHFSREFGNWQWEDYRTEVERYQGALMVKAAAPDGSSEPMRLERAPSDRQRPEVKWILRESREVRKLQHEPAIIGACVPRAENFRKQYGVRDGDLEAIAGELHNLMTWAQITVADGRARVWGVQPISYWYWPEKNLSVVEKAYAGGLLVNSVLCFTAARSFLQHHADPGAIGWAALKKARPS